MTSYNNNSKILTTNLGVNKDDDHIRVNVRPIFMSTFGEWNKENRIYSKILPSEELKKCKSTCNAFFSIDKASSINDKTKTNQSVCNEYCEKLYDQYKDDSEAMIAVNKYCKLSDISSNKLCLSKNKNKIINEIKNLCGTDEPCNVYNNDIINQIFLKNNIMSKTFARHKFSNIESFTKSTYKISNKVSVIILIIIFICVVLGIFFILK